MALYIHYGSSGSGKTYNLIRDTLCEASKQRDTSFFVVVPEQFTLQTQRAFIAKSEEGGIMNIDVLSFSRLAGRIFDEFGGNKKTVLEDTGKSMIVKKVLLEKQKELTVYGGNVMKQGFVDEIKSVIAEFYQYDIDESDIDMMIESSAKKPLMRRKLEDIRIIYRGFREFLSERYITNEEILDKACAMVEEAKLLEGAVICLDGFTGFTPSQNKFLLALMKKVRDIHVTLTMSEEYVGKTLKEHSLFYLSYKTADKLRRMAADCQVDEVITHESGVPKRYAASPALAHLERNLFRPRITEFCEEQNDVSIILGGTRREEVQVAITEIKRLLRSGMRGSEIAIVSGDLQGYARVFGEEFDKEGISYFIDEKRNILKTPLVELARSAIGIVQDNFSYESVFRLLRCGLSPLSAAETDVLENYCIALGIKGRKKWNSEFTYAYKTREALDLEALNQARRKFVELVEPFAAVLKDKRSTVKECLEALYVLVKKGYEANSDQTKDETFKQTAGLFADMLDRLNMLLGEDVISLDEFSAIVDTGFKEAKLRVLPPSPDSIIVGDIERTRIEGVKALFFLGVNDAVVPKRASTGGVLSDSDRDFLEGMGMELAPSGRTQSYLAEFYLYLNVTKPSDKLYLSYYCSDDEGKAARPAYLIDKILKLFEHIDVITPLTVASRDDAGRFDTILGTDRGYSSLCRAIRDGAGSEEKELGTLAALFRQENPKRIERLLDSIEKRCGKECITGEHAAHLYGNVLEGSITRLEEYSRCAFAHFLKYGLKLEDRREFEIAATDLGSILHKALELFSKRLKDEKISWRSLNDNIKESYIDDGLKEAAEGYGGGIFESSDRNAYVLVQLKAMLKRTVNTLEQQISAGSMEPAFFEESFSHTGKYMRLRGKIDRMDVVVENGKAYLRVVDYKSGKKSFDLKKLYYGLSLQLGIYLEEGMYLAKNSGLIKADEIVPAGMYYYHIDDPIVDAGKDTEAEIMKELRMDGLSNSSYAALSIQDMGLVGNDGGFAKSYKSDIIKVETTKDCILGSRSVVAEGHQIDALTKYLEESAKKQSEQIMAGDTAVLPYKYKKETGCDYCDYNSVCGFGKVTRAEYRNLGDIDDSEIWEDICRKEDGPTHSKR